VISIKSKIVDTNVLLRSGGTSLGNMIAPDSVREEIESERGATNLMLEEVSFRNPSSDHLDEVQEVSREINSPTSRTDEEVVALALETGLEIVSDDLAVQNLAAHLGLDFSGFMEDSVEELREWSWRCSGCGEELDSEEKCPLCGAAAERYTSSREKLGE
jgi:UPF0271 protein